MQPVLARNMVESLQKEFGCSQRRACRVIDANRCTVRRPDTPDKDAVLRTRLRELADERSRFGVRRLHILLREEGLVVNHKRTERIYREEKLALRRKRAKKRPASTRKPDMTVSGSGECLAMDFVHDSLADGRKIRILSVVDLYDRSCPSLEVGFSYSSQRVIQTLERLRSVGQLASVLRVDNGPEFTSNAIQCWAAKNGITIKYSRPGCPTDNGHVESFNGKLRDECLNQNLFSTLQEARDCIERWRQDYNTNRPHSALGWRTPAAYRELRNSEQAGVANL